jgi:hypothetical protein
MTGANLRSRGARKGNRTARHRDAARDAPAPSPSPPHPPSRTAHRLRIHAPSAADCAAATAMQPCTRRSQIWTCVTTRTIPDPSGRQPRRSARRCRLRQTLSAAAIGLLALLATATGARVGGPLLFHEDFSAGHANSLLTWGDPAPAVAADPLAADGMALRYRWQEGFENYNGAFRALAGAPRTLHVRLRLRQDAGADNSGIQKIVRFRANVDGVDDRAVGTFNFQWGSLLFNGDDFGDGNNHPQAAATLTSHGPDSFRGGYRYLEVRLDYGEPGTQRFGAWVDGLQVIDGAVALSQPWPASGWLEGVMVLGTFNDPADTRSDWIDEIRIATGYIGVDRVFASDFEPT